MMTFNKIDYYLKQLDESSTTKEKDNPFWLRVIRNISTNIRNYKLEQQRKEEAAKTKSDVDSITNTLSEEEKILMGWDEGETEYLTINEGKRVVARFIQYDGSIPVAFVDLMDVNTKSLNAAAATRSGKKYRGKGYSSKCVQEALQWFNNNKDTYGYTQIVWWAHKKNIASQRVAEKNGFILDTSNTLYKDWNKYIYK